jgi:hypothetical protein
LRERSVALVTRDPVLYGEMAAFLRERHIPTVSLLPGQKIPEKVAVVITSKEEAATVGFPRVLVATLGDAAILGGAIRQALHSDAVARVLWVGVDTGPRPGYAVLNSSGACLVEGQVESPEEVATLARRLLRTFPHADLTFRVGRGDALRRARILNALVPLDVVVEVTNEHRTTLPGRRQNDVLAAKAIAATPGEPVREGEELKITPGEIANLQRISREMSGGKFTLPRESAASVLEGRITMADALRASAERLGLDPASQGRGREGPASGAKHRPRRRASPESKL